MKIKKLLFLSLFLIIGLFLFIPNTVNATTTTINEITIDFDGAVPVVGQSPKDIIINSDKYEIVAQQWSDPENGLRVTEFANGKAYCFDMYIKAKAGYTFSAPLITTKNITWDTDYNRGIVTDPANQYYGCVFISGYYTTGTVNANIEIDGTTNIIPIVGEAPQYLTISSDEFEIFSQQWYDENFNLVSTFEAEKEYYYVLYLKHKTAYGWDSASSLHVKNIDWLMTFSGSNLSEGTLGFAGTIKPVEVEKYNIIVNQVEGVTITPNETIQVQKGEDQTLKIIANKGYKITAVKVNDAEQTLVEDILTINNITENKNIVVEAERCIYKINNNITNLKSNNTATTTMSLTEYNTTLSANEGYTLPDMVYVLIDGNELNTTSYSYNKETGKLVIPAERVTGDITIVGESVKIYTYKFIIGDNQTFTLNKIDEYSFKIDGDYTLFSKVVISDLNLVKDVDYTVKEGSTIITFTEKGLEKLNTLAVGTHDVVVEYSNNKEVTGKITIKADTTTKDNTNNGTSSNNNTNGGNNPQTGDNIMVFVAILGISTMGIIATTIIRKKLKNN